MYEYRVLRHAASCPKEIEDDLNHLALQGFRLVAVSGASERGNSANGTIDHMTICILEKSVPTSTDNDPQRR